MNKHLTAVPHTLNASDRAAHYGHRGAVLWLTGLSASGKPSLSMALEHALTDSNKSGDAGELCGSQDAVWRASAYLSSLRRRAVSIAKIIICIAGPNDFPCGNYPQTAQRP